MLYEFQFLQNVIKESSFFLFFFNILIIITNYFKYNIFFFDLKN